MRVITSLSLTFCLSLLLTACTTETKKEKVAAQLPDELTAVRGIRYTEVKRRFSNGLSFDTSGFQQEPSWIIQFKNKDTVLAYDPGKKVMQGFFLQHDHAAVYNFAKEWFRFKLISRDSLVFQRLQVTHKVIADDIRSDVNMTFYSDDYIKNKLQTTAAALQRPSKADTLFISELIKRANQNPGNRDSVFAGRKIARLTPLDNRITVERLSGIDRLNGITEAYDYLYPRFRVVIPEAYKAFAYEFTVLVDEKGKLRLGNFYTNLPEYRAVRKKVLAGITDVYLQHLLKINPGTTLGMPHASEITVQVVGRKSSK